MLGVWWIKDWLRIQQSHTIRNKHQSIDTIVWMAKGIAKYQDLIRSMWSERNEQLHRTETSEESRRGNNEVKARIEEIYSTIARVAPNRQLMTKDEERFFRRDKETIKKKKIQTNQKWATNTEDILEACQKRTQDGQTMRDFILFQLQDYNDHANKSYTRPSSTLE